MQSKELKKKLNLVRKFVAPKNTSLPVLRCVNVGPQSLAATDLEVYARVPIELPVDRNLAINIDELWPIVDAWDEGEVLVSNQDNKLILEGQTTRAVLEGTRGEFPEVPPEGEGIGPVNLADLKQVMPFAGTDDARPILTMIHLAGPFAEAADGFALGRVEGNRLEGEAMFPARLIKKLPNDQYAVHVYGSTTTLASDQIVVTAQVEPGSYYNVNAVLEGVDRSRHTIFDSAQEVRRALKTLKKLAGDTGCIAVDGLKLSVAGFTKTLSGNDRMAPDPFHANANILEKAFQGKGRVDLYGNHWGEKFLFEAGSLTSAVMPMNRGGPDAI